VIGESTLGARSFLSEGAVVRAEDSAVVIGAGSAVIENCVVIGTAAMPATIGRRTVFGHRCLVVGATVGDLCEMGNASILMPGSRLGDRVFLGEGTLVPPGASRATWSRSGVLPELSEQRRKRNSTASEGCAAAT
jgi:carbonic anhydrase/acetyltransferase-like protein (isoleucine patch superfamily)